MKRNPPLITIRLQVPQGLARAIDLATGHGSRSDFLRRTLSKSPPVRKAAREAGIEFEEVAAPGRPKKPTVTPSDKS